MVDTSVVPESIARDTPTSLVIIRHDRAHHTSRTERQTTDLIEPGFRRGVRLAGQAVNDGVGDEHDQGNPADASSETTHVTE